MNFTNKKTSTLTSVFALGLLLAFSQLVAAVDDFPKANRILPGGDDDKITLADVQSDLWTMLNSRRTRANVQALTLNTEARSIAYTHSKNLASSKSAVSGYIQKYATALNATEIKVITASINLLAKHDFTEESAADIMFQLRKNTNFPAAGSNAAFTKGAIALFRSAAKGKVYATLIVYR